MTFITRFAPSPTGPLHLGHAYSALVAFDLARQHGGQFLLRIEDIDQSRARASWEAQIYDDLNWLGLVWEKPVLRQSENVARYGAALDMLWASDQLYPCYCSRRDIKEAASAPQEGAPMTGPDGLVYPRTCPMTINGAPASEWPRPIDQNLRLHLAGFSDLAVQGQDGPAFQFHEHGRGPQGEHGLIEVPLVTLDREIGDIVVSRSDMHTSYHLSVVVDDAAQGVTHVVRGEDLFEATKIHVVLQKALGLATPIYHHHPLIRDENGKRLAKRDDARALSKYRAEGASPDDIRALVGLTSAH